MTGGMFHPRDYRVRELNFDNRAPSLSPITGLVSTKINAVMHQADIQGGQRYLRLRKVSHPCPVAVTLL
jgi:hypothetical protein